MFVRRDVVEMLLSHEASCNVVDDKGSSPLHLAAWKGDEQVVSLLLTHGPSVPNVNLLVSVKPTRSTTNCLTVPERKGDVGQL